MKVTSQLIDKIQNKINLHYQLYDFKIDNILWENILHRSFKELGYNSHWDTGSHKQGTDIVCNETKISCKGGSIHGKRVPKLKISSHRTTSYKTLTEKIDYISRPHEDVIWSLVQSSEKTYCLHLIEPPNFKSYNWEETSGGWRASCPNNIHKARIQRSMSDQLWIEFDYNYLLQKTETYNFVIP